MKELSLLCVSGDQDFLTDQGNSITGNVEVLEENTENQKSLLESRMESWKVFPVEAAVDVQEFLEAVSKEVEEEDDFDECSGEELMLKLERLEVSSINSNDIQTCTCTSTCTFIQYVHLVNTFACCLGAKCMLSWSL